MAWVSTHLTPLDPMRWRSPWRMRSRPRWLKLRTLDMPSRSTSIDSISVISTFFCISATFASHSRVTPWISSMALARFTFSSLFCFMFLKTVLSRSV